MVKLDLGCGVNKLAGYIGVDILPFAGVDIVTDLTQKWQWEDNSVDEVHCSHFIEHLTATERVHFANELYRVLKPGCKCIIVTPHWASCRAYGDPTHSWPPVSEFWYFYLNRDWRLGNVEKNVPANAPHTDASNIVGGFVCDFDATCSYGLNPIMSVKSQDFQQFAIQFYKEAANDMIATIIKR